MGALRGGNEPRLGPHLVTTIREVWAKLRASVSRRPRLGDELAEEMESHLSMAVEDLVAGGMSPEAARAASRRSFGNLHLTRERAREQWSFPAIETVVRDLHHGVRGLRRNPSFTLTVIATLALGIGATTAIFSVVDQVLLRPLPFPAADRLVWLEENSPRAHGFSVTWLNFQAWLRDNHTFEDMAGFFQVHRTLTGNGEAALLRFASVSSHFPGLAGMAPLAGRLFTEKDDQPGAAATVVLDGRFWAEHYGADLNLIGKTVVLDGRPTLVIGVSSPTDFFPLRPDGYLPLGQTISSSVRRNDHGSMRVLARLRPHTSLAAAQADLDAIMRHLAEVDPGPESDHRVAALFLQPAQTHAVRPSLLLLLGAVALVLLISCANVTSLLLARGTVRTGEIALRLAVGAGRRRIARQLLTESLLLTGFGGLVGLAVADLCLRCLLRFAPVEIPRLAATTLDFRVLVFVALVTVVTGVVMGLAPIAAAREVDVAAALSSCGRAGLSRRGIALRSAFVVGEIALTLVLAFGAGLLLRSLQAAQSGDPGFRPDHVLALEVALPSYRYAEGQASGRYFAQLLERLSRIPGVISAGAVDCPPATSDCNDWFFSVPGRAPAASADDSISLFVAADPQYFQTLRIPVIEGRPFVATDRGGSPRVAVLSARLAHRIWPAGSAIGQRIKVGPPQDPGDILEVVGVVGDVRGESLDGEALPEIFQPLAQSPKRAMAVLLRTSVAPESLEATVRRRVSELDPAVPLQSLRTMPERLASTLARRRFGTGLLVAFALLALLLAAVGIFGLLDFWVRAHEREIAVRAALGASRPQLIGEVFRRLLPLAASGATVGVLGAVAATHSLEGLIYGVSPADPVTWVAAVIAVVGIAFAGAAAPAWHAVRIDPQRRLQAG
jgi:putative ABC transport system permease protein